jgi:hypothetical protein
LRKFLPYVLFSLGFLLLAAAAWYGLHTTRSAPGVAFSDNIPASLAGLALTEKTTGAEAVAQIQNLHLGDIAIVDAVGAAYGAQQAVMWIAAAESEARAAALVAEMETAIASGGSPFAPLGVLGLGGREVFEVEGLGQLHFFYRTGDKVIWLSASPALAKQALTEVMGFYP